MRSKAFELCSVLGDSGANIIMAVLSATFKVTNTTSLELLMKILAPLLILSNKMPDSEFKNIVRFLFNCERRGKPQATELLLAMESDEVFKKRLFNCMVEIVKNTTVSYTHLTLPTILRV